ncbi:hypothetical protein PVK06_019155 [Gossypium arboreum]|uniref:Uncharacterized protein n=1 Tax=Gossypium arboreum TaxID=29729 RepID=A0ABR0PJ83_GOSAR|nr:hypothetical protein PVK06_019155 [Gossypium arboreum]
MNDERPQLQQDPPPSVRSQSALVSLQDESIQSVSTLQSSGNIFGDLKSTRPTMALNNKAFPVTHPFVV